MRSRRVQGPAGGVDLPVPACLCVARRQARQTGKTHAVHDGQQWVTQSVQRFVYDDWNVVMVLDENNDVIRKYTLDTPPPAAREGSRRDPGAPPLAARQGYTWGLDLSGLHGVGPASSRSGIHGAGGIGGLLAAVEKHDPESSSDDETFWYFYDAEPLTRRATRSVGACGPRARPVRRVKGHGNVTQVLDATNTGNITLAAHYVYDPYGNVLWSKGPYKDANPFRFSTKWFDDETHLGYWGYRYYSGRLGRWLGRDPIEERAGANLCGFVYNAPINRIDFLGLFFGCSCDDHSPPPQNKCADCWQTCLQNQNLFQPSVGGGVICRADGCECACVKESMYNLSDPCDQAIRKCDLQHEEHHVSDRKCACPCSPKPCLMDTAKKWVKDVECDAWATSINCLCNEKNKNPKCSQEIVERIKQGEAACAALGGDVYKHGAKKCY